MKSIASTAVVLCLALSAFPVAGRCEVAADLALKLQRVLDRNVGRHEIRGVSAAVVFDNGSVWTGASGISHDAVAMDPEMLFAIGSVTKNVVATLVLDLVEEGRLSLDDTLSAHLPPFDHVDSGITIRQLLNHTSGIYNFFDSDAVWAALKADRGRVWTPEELLAYLEKPYFEPGGGWRYSNTNYVLVGMIVERVTAMTLEVLLKERFWTPLGIDGVFFDPDWTPGRMAHVFGDNFQYGAVEKDLTYEPRASHESMIYGAGGLFMTAADLARWSQALFGGEVLAPASLDEMCRFVPFRPVANMRSYGLGVQTFERRFSFGLEAIGHGGGNIGSATYMVYLPQQRVSVVAMVNAFPTSSIDDFTRGLMRVVLRDMGALGWLPYIPPLQRWLFLASLTILISVALYRRRRRAA